MTIAIPGLEIGSSDIRDLASDYGLVVTQAQPLSGGMENVHVKLSTSSGATVVVTYLRKKSPEQAAHYALFLRQIHELPSHPAPRLRQRLDGAWTTHHLGLPVIVCDFADGVSPHRFPEKMLRPAGQLLARIHHDTAELTSELTPHLRMCADDMDTLDSLADSPLAHWARRTWTRVSDVPDRSGPRGFVHADVFPDNVVLQNRTRILLLDWEDGSRDLCALDVAVAVLGLCCQNRFSPSRSRQLLAGYSDSADTQPDMTLIRDSALYTAVLIALRRHRWQTLGHVPPDPQRSAAVMARIAAGLARDWRAALP